MNENFKSKLLISTFLILIISSIIKKSNSQNSNNSSIIQEIVNNCKEYKNSNRIKSFSDCKIYSNEAYGQICCYLTGVNSDNSHYDGCISVNSNLFANKSISYSSRKISGTLICTDNYNYNKNINISFLSLIMLFLIFM